MKLFKDETTEKTALFAALSAGMSQLILFLFLMSADKNNIIEKKNKIIEFIDNNPDVVKNLMEKFYLTAELHEDAMLLFRPAIQNYFDYLVNLKNQNQSSAD